MRKTLIVEHTAERATGIIWSLEQFGEKYEVFQPYLELPASLNEKAFDRLILSGGSGSAQETLDQPWYKPAQELISRFLDNRRPILGLCLGHQIMALLFGGTVERHDFRRGWQEIKLTEDGRSDPIFDGCEETFTVFHYNQDEVTTMPEGGILLATAPNCKVESYSIPDVRVWGTQCHPEIYPSLARSILASRIPRDQWLGCIPPSHSPSCLHILQNFCTM